MGSCAKFGIVLVAFLWVAVPIVCGQVRARPDPDFLARNPIICDPESRRYSGTPGRDLTLDHYLYEAGTRVDCYYTIEDLLEGEEQPKLILYSRSMMLPYSDSGHDVRKVVKHLNDHLTGYVAIQNETNSQVVHIIDKRLARSKKYVMDSSSTIDYKGPLTPLTKAIGDSTGGRMHPRRRGITVGLESNKFNSTFIRVIGKNQRVRDLLTNYVPLSKHCRLLWHAEIYPTPNGLTAAVHYKGSAPLHNHGDWWSIDEAIPFALGHPAYVHNSEKQIPAAIDYIKKEITSSTPAQVRWAMFFLGKHKRKEDIPILLKYLDYRYTTCQIVEESYPAVNALMTMGPLASAPIAQALPNESSALRRRLLCYSLLCINGAQKGREIIQAILTDMKDDEQKKSIQVALTQAHILFKNSPNSPIEGAASH